ncbi:MAG TPA: hypothetical protein VED16_01040 [Candidatus Acidoferrum sp.]|nr:hypothetical protein [Candidatus Acidoferrum sp.]
MPHLIRNGVEPEAATIVGPIQMFRRRWSIYSLKMKTYVISITQLNLKSLHGLRFRAYFTP